MKRYLLVSWWNGKNPKGITVVPEVEEITDGNSLEEKAREKKRYLGPDSKVLIVEVIKEVKEK